MVHLESPYKNKKVNGLGIENQNGGQLFDPLGEREKSNWPNNTPFNTFVCMPLRGPRKVAQLEVLFDFSEKGSISQRFCGNLR